MRCEVDGGAGCAGAGCGVRAAGAAGGDDQFDDLEFFDTTNWCDDNGSPATSFSNLGVSYLGNGSAVVLDCTNGVVELRYPMVYSTNGGFQTNMTSLATTLALWWVPGSWATGTGPGTRAPLFEVGCGSSRHLQQAFDVFQAGGDFGHQVGQLSRFQAQNAHGRKTAT